MSLSVYLPLKNVSCACCLTNCKGKLVVCNSQKRYKIGVRTNCKIQILRNCSGEENDISR